MPKAALKIQGLSKTYDGGFQALKAINLEIRKGEIFALLGPNGAGKTTLINITCGLVRPTEGTVEVGGFDIISQYRKTRSIIGLVPQELVSEAFETVFDAVTHSRGLFGKPANPSKIETILRSLSLWEKKDSVAMTLSGGMKRRVLIAKALSHEPDLLFLDEPTAGVDVELRKDMWQLVRELRASGVTVVLTTHYIEEAEEMADRVGVIHKGEIILVKEKQALMDELGSKQLIVELSTPLDALPQSLSGPGLELSGEGTRLVYTYKAASQTGISQLLQAITEAGIEFSDIHSQQSSLEDIFVDLIHGDKK